MTWLDANDIADMAGVHTRTIQRWCRERRIPHLKVGRCLRFTAEHVRQIEDAYSVSPETRSEVDTPNPAFGSRVVEVSMEPLPR